MNTNHSANNNLARILNEVRVKTNPLPTSFIADKVDNHIKTTYATLMASILLHNPVGDTESRLYAMQLTALGLDDDISKYFNLVQGLNTEQVLECCQALNTAEKQLTFLFDVLMLCRAGSPLNEQQIYLVNEFVSIWDLPEKYIASLTFWVKIILGINIDYYNLPSNLEIIKIKGDDSKTFYNFERLVENNKFVISKSTKIASYRVVGNSNPNTKPSGVWGSISIHGSKNISNNQYNEIVLSNCTGILFDVQVINGNYEYYIIVLPSYLEKWTDLIDSLTIHNH
ncbi:hypothetical protein H9W84_03305 [Moraxella sp. PS-22]|uniref:Uncharacterized protein n=1 Tax=Moraxella tetraodonis TaxID=2767221 RepID=A0A9X2A3H5_9GAMM|nr:hypothetical protein [Moraxella tetraodonis]MCG8147153.1 hypothetical protein [Moraxella tetraodonis]